MAGVVAAKFLLPKGHAQPEVLYPAATFALTDQDAKPFGHQDLKGRPYVAAFVFTQCGSTCPRMTADMAAMQKDLPRRCGWCRSPSIPERDTPAGAEAVRRHVQGRRDPLAVPDRPVRRDQKVGPGDDGRHHQEAGGRPPDPAQRRLFLVDGENRVRKLYHSRSADDVKQLVVDAKYLASHPDK
jgi:hypothetical protein